MCTIDTDPIESAECGLYASPGGPVGISWKIGQGTASFYS